MEACKKIEKIALSIQAENLQKAGKIATGFLTFSPIEP